MVLPFIVSGAVADDAQGRFADIAEPVSDWPGNRTVELTQEIN
jgi:hypothetical protein